MKTNKILITVTFMLILGIANTLWAMTLDQAYRSIPHRRTVFLPNYSSINSTEQIYLMDLFDVVEMAMLERVEMLLWLKSYGKRGNESTDYPSILDDLRSMDPPPKLIKMHQLIVSAIEDQQSFLVSWKNKGFSAKINLSRHPKVRSASRKLQGAYKILINIYPNEDQHNKQSFFDYLCALDFI